MVPRLSFTAILGLALCSLLALELPFAVDGFSISSAPQRPSTRTCNNGMITKRPIFPTMANAPYRRKNFAMESRNNGNGDDPQSTYYYSDDCFGLIFLSTGLVAGDVVFASCFALISAVAATYFNKNAKELNAKLQKQFPGAVAGLTLLFVAPVTRVVLQPNSLDFLPERAPFATILEIGVCALSVVYSLVATQQEKEA
mmetsp:Transcript_2064/g.4524  ORF Transcript_2064/g.4524 Transcript_2064/m.4524 type:complete len:199 (+) Transcript_2064:52-648(+)